MIPGPPLWLHQELQTYAESFCLEAVPTGSLQKVQHGRLPEHCGVAWKEPFDEKLIPDDMTGTR